MARIAQGLTLDDVWARLSTLVQEPSAQGLVRSTGFPASFGVDMFVALETWNGMLREITAMLLDIADHGILEWTASPNRPYAHPCVTLGSDNEIYTSVQAGGEAEDPTADTNNTYWQSLSDRLAAFATATDVNAGTSGTLSVTPLRMLQALFVDNPNDQWKALTTRFGLVKRATSGEVTGKTGDGYVRAADLPDADVVSATETTEGISRRATPTEADDGTATGPHMTPALVRRQVPALPSSDGLYGLRVDGGTRSFESLPFEVFAFEAASVDYSDGDIVGFAGTNSWAPGAGTFTVMYAAVATYSGLSLGHAELYVRQGGGAAMRIAGQMSRTVSGSGSEPLVTTWTGTLTAGDVLTVRAAGGSFSMANRLLLIATA